MMVTNCTPHNNLADNAREELGDCVSHHTLKRFWITQISFPEICRLAQMQLLFTSTAGNLFLLLLPDITPHNILYQAQTLASSLSTDFPILYFFFYLPNSVLFSSVCGCDMSPPTRKACTCLLISIQLHPGTFSTFMSFIICLTFWMSSHLPVAA